MITKMYLFLLDLILLFNSEQDFSHVRLEDHPTHHQFVEDVMNLKKRQKGNTPLSDALIKLMLVRRSQSKCYGKNKGGTKFFAKSISTSTFIDRA